MGRTKDLYACSLTARLFSVYVDVSFNKCQSAIGFYCDCVYVFVPAHVRGNVNTEIFGLVRMLQL